MSPKRCANRDRVTQALLRAPDCPECKRRDQLVTDACPYCLTGTRVVCTRCSRVVVEHL